jgi:dCMP deaminase
MKKDDRPTRDEMFMEVAYVLRKRSSCLRGKVGVVVVGEDRILASGYNGAPPGAPHCFEVGCLVDENLHVLGCQRAIHAEANAIAWAARHGARLMGATMYCTHGPCLKCAQLIIAAGIERLVYGVPYRLPEGLELLAGGGDVECLRLILMRDMIDGSTHVQAPGYTRETPVSAVWAGDDSPHSHSDETPDQLG